MLFNLKIFSFYRRYSSIKFVTKSNFILSSILEQLISEFGKYIEGEEIRHHWFSASVFDKRSPLALRSYALIPSRMICRSPPSIVNSFNFIVFSLSCMLQWFRAVIRIIFWPDSERQNLIIRSVYDRPANQTIDVFAPANQNSQIFALVASDNIGFGIRFTTWKVNIFIVLYCWYFCVENQCQRNDRANTANSQGSRFSYIISVPLKQILKQIIHRPFSSIANMRFSSKNDHLPPLVGGWGQISIPKFESVLSALRASSISTITSEAVGDDGNTSSGQCWMKQYALILLIFSSRAVIIILYYLSFITTAGTFHLYCYFCSVQNRYRWVWSCGCSQLHFNGAPRRDRFGAIARTKKLQPRVLCHRYQVCESSTKKPCTAEYRSATTHTLRLSGTGFQNQNSVPLKVHLENLQTYSSRHRPPHSCCRSTICDTVRKVVPVVSTLPIFWRQPGIAEDDRVESQNISGGSPTLAGISPSNRKTKPSEVS